MKIDFMISIFLMLGFIGRRDRCLLRWVRFFFLLRVLMVFNNFIEFWIVSGFGGCKVLDKNWLILLSFRFLICK